MNRFLVRNRTAMMGAVYQLLLFLEKPGGGWIYWRDTNWSEVAA